MIPFIFFKFFEKLAKAIFEWNYNKFSRSILLIKNTLRYLCFDVNLHFIKSASNLTTYLSLYQIF